jgi:hypothetical protein
MKSASATSSASAMTLAALEAEDALDGGGGLNFASVVAVPQR